MNANELANELVNTNYTPLKAECAAMLRQLQAENEALKKRELTDEEILQVARKSLLNDQLWLDIKIDKDAVEATLDFAKAILRKAQEK